ncbi:response regulator transcription factor [Lacisediminihabitans sp.]|jgi:two-component system OmpR family response regulator|uniref:response regulator transcription factor n=1 Tax=Lacisediminihabitans sp. TaxID=2787631 RepID=UPI002F949BBB
MVTRILVVEDDAAMGALVERGLRDEGYDVTLVGNGIDALIAAANEEFGAAAIDVMLPEMTGFEICRHLRNHGNTLPILLLTARDAVEDRVFGLDSGADDYLTKPFAFVEFSARIRALVRREASSSKPVVRVGQVSLDAETVRATIDGTAFPLSTKEFTLLRLLATRKDTTLSRTEILSEVWGTTKHIDPTIVDQYVRYLRRKLEPVDAGFTIATVRGVGYTLHVDDEV